MTEATIYHQGDYETWMRMELAGKKLRSLADEAGIKWDSERRAYGGTQEQWTAFIQAADAHREGCDYRDAQSKRAKEAWARETRIVGIKFEECPTRPGMTNYEAAEFNFFEGCKVAVLEKVEDHLEAVPEKFKIDDPEAVEILWKVVEKMKAEQVILNINHPDAEYRGNLWAYLDQFGGQLALNAYIKLRSPETLEALRALRGQ